jgi:hypothetical protein
MPAFEIWHTPMPGSSATAAQTGSQPSIVQNLVDTLQSIKRQRGLAQHLAVVVYEVEILNAGSVKRSGLEHLPLKREVS